MKKSFMLWKPIIRDLLFNYKKARTPLDVDGSSGKIERYKARLVAKGFHQQECVDFEDLVLESCTHVYMA
ncbi:hypothetical protein OSB04_028150 [Centaurea solstitialis]|uniref:Reverse transcriptase n=1 Tax=Centaurea solstitialis TaxID=347529 RepID=A0AA38SGP5_9ASTR|nr:hypothetical protein OSB04_028150 [Centaurea solstitialis]